MKSFIIFLSICFSGFGFAQNKSVLFLGNSYTGVNNLPLLVYEIALSQGDTLLYDSNTPGGHTFNLHRANPTTLAKISSRNWDYVVLQEQSQIPSLPEAITGPDYSPPHAMELNEIIKENDTCSKVVFYMTWGRKSGDASFCDEHPPVCTYEGMQGELRNAYLDMTIENDARVAPVGMGWKTVIDDDPSIELYSGDGSHPNINGSYLTACIMYATIYQKSPMDASYIASLDEDLAVYLQEKAHDIVFDSLATWRIGLNDLTVGFDFTHTDLDYDFASNSEHATSWEWLIDESTYMEENPSHSFNEPSIYDVTLTVYDGCDTLTETQTVTVGSAALLDVENKVKLYPNPANETLYLQGFNNSNTVVNIYDLYGRTVGVYKINSNGEIDLSTMSSGTYILNLGSQFYKFVKK